MDGRYGKYVPDVVEAYREFAILSEVEGRLLEEAFQKKEEFIRNQWILSADENGLKRFAKIMGLSIVESDLEVFREMVLFYWNSTSPYTFLHLLDWLDGYCGAGNFRAEILQNTYTLQVLLELCVKEKRAFVQKILRQTIPANMVLRVLLNSNTHGKVNAVKHRDLAKLRYGEVATEDFSMAGF